MSNCSYKCQLKARHLSLSQILEYNYSIYNCHSTFLYPTESSRYTKKIVNSLKKKTVNLVSSDYFNLVLYSLVNKKNNFGLNFDLKSVMSL